MSADAFDRADLEALGAAVGAAWQAGSDADWSAPAGTLEWSSLRTADHLVDAVLAVGLFLAARDLDGYPEWGWGEQLMGPAATPARLIQAMAAAVRVVAGVIAVAEPDARAVIWRTPRPEVRGPGDFAPRAGLELALHGHDVCAGLAVPFSPAPDLVARLVGHTRAWPHWTLAPGWAPVVDTGDPWSDLLRASGRRP